MRQLIETRLQKLILITAILLLISFVAAPFVLAQSQNWYLTNTTTSVGYIMIKGTPGSGAAISVASGSTTTWIAGNAATINVTFPAATWSGSITMTTANANSTYTGYVQIGVLTPPSTFTQVGPNSNTMSWSKGSSAVAQSFSISAPALSVPQSSILSLRYVWTGGRTADVITNSSCYVAYPVANPAYPVPDVQTLVLFAAGLAVVGFVLWKIRRKPSTDQPV